MTETPRNKTNIFFCTCKVPYLVLVIYPELVYGLYKSLMMANLAHYNNFKDDIVKVTC